MGMDGSPTAAWTAPSASATTTAPTWRLSTNPERSTSTSTCIGPERRPWARGGANAGVAGAGQDVAAVQRRVDLLEISDRYERLSHRRVELGAGAGHDLLEGPLVGHRAPVGPVGGHGVEGVADREDARAQRDLLAAQAGGIAASVPALVVGADDLHRRSERLDAGHHLHPDLRVHPHDQPLLLVERAGLVQDGL